MPSEQPTREEPTRDRDRGQRRQWSNHTMCQRSRTQPTFVSAVGTWKRHVAEHARRPRRLQRVTGTERHNKTVLLHFKSNVGGLCGNAGRRQRRERHQRTRPPRPVLCERTGPTHAALPSGPQRSGEFRLGQNPRLDCPAAFSAFSLRPQSLHVTSRQLEASTFRCCRWLAPAESCHSAAAAGRSQRGQPSTSPRPEQVDAERDQGDVSDGLRA